MNILIIGSGYLGLAAGIYLRKKGHKVTGTTRSQEKLQAIKSHLNEAFLLNADTMPNVFKDQEIVLFTAAADNAATYKEAYLDNAEAIKKAFEHEHSLKQVIYSSSTSVYGDHKGAPVTEDTPPSPLSTQGQILLKTEQTLQSMSKSCIFRLGELIGQGRSIEERIRRADGTKFSGSGDAITNFSQLQDVIRAIDFAIEKPLFGIFNLCSQFHAPRKELYEQITQSRKLNPVAWDNGSTSLHGGNKTVISEKLICAGFKFESLPWEGILA